MAIVGQGEAQGTNSAVNPRRLELETAKEILAEVFGALPSDVEEMRLARVWANLAKKIAPPETTLV